MGPFVGRRRDAEVAEEVGETRRRLLIGRSAVARAGERAVGDRSRMIVWTGRRTVAVVGTRARIVAAHAHVEVSALERSASRRRHLRFEARAIVLLFPATRAQLRGRELR